MIVKVKPKDVVLEARKLEAGQIGAIYDWSWALVYWSTYRNAWIQDDIGYPHGSWAVKYSDLEMVIVFDDEEFKEKFDIVDEGGEGVIDIKEIEYPGDIVCNFCLKKIDKVLTMVAGPCGYICDGCIKLCAKILLVEAKQFEEEGGEG